MDRTLYALDLAKQVFHAYWVESRNSRDKRLKRDQVLQFFSRLAPARAKRKASIMPAGPPPATQQRVVTRAGAEASMSLLM